jgi:hypothetical protein
MVPLSKIAEHSSAMYGVLVLIVWPFFDGFASNSASTQRVCSGLNIFISESFDRFLEGLASYTSGTE